MGDPDLEAYALILGLFVRLAWEPEGWAEAAQPEAAKAIAAFEAIGDERGLGKAWALLGLVHIEKAQFAEAERAWEKAAGHSRSGGDRREQLESLAWVPVAVWAGPTPVTEGLQRCAEVVERAEGDKKVLGSALAAQAAFEAGLGHFDVARGLIRDAKAVLQEVALSVWLAGPVAQLAGWVELLAGDAAAADRELRSGYDTLTRLGELSWLSTLAAILAEAVYEQGRHDEAERLILACEASAGAEDAYSQALLRSVRAKLLAQRGDTGQAEQLADEAVAFADRTDLLRRRDRGAEGKPRRRRARCGAAPNVGPGLSSSVARGLFELSEEVAGGAAFPPIPGTES